MSETESAPKRTLNRRKAAEKSEKKWKEAFEEEQTYEALPDVFLGSRIGTEAQIEDTYHTRAARIKSATSTKSARERLNRYHKEPSNFTILEDSAFREIIESLACVICFTQSLNIQLLKSSWGQTEEIIISCSKCNKTLLQKLITQKTSQNSIHKLGSGSPCDDCTKSGECFKKKDNNDGEGAGVELLVCDVDVMKEEQQQQKGTETEQQDFRPSSPGPPPEGEEEDGTRIRRRRRARVKKKPGSSPKPIRPCFFCSKMQARLSRHVKSTHVTHPYVQTMLRQSPDVQARMMRQLRSEGIFAENQRRLRAGRADLLRIRNQGSGELSACGYCRGYYKKKLLWRHRATCIARPRPLNSGHEEEEEQLWAGEVDGGEDCPLRLLLSPQGGEDNNNTEEASKGDGSAADPPEISRIREILDGLEHGIFSQGGTALVGGTVVNGFFIKQERVEEAEEGEREELGDDTAPVPPNNHELTQLGGGSDDNVLSANHQHHPEAAQEEATGTPPQQLQLLSQQQPAVNEDQLLFDSLPAILSNSTHMSGAPTPVKKRKRDYSWNGKGGEEAFSDENYYYMWPEVSSLSSFELQHHELLPCNTLYQSNRKRKPRSEFQYQFWKKEDEDTILNYFTDMIKAMKVPGKDACREFLSKHPDIKTDWTRVKYKVYNQIQKQKKKMRKE